MKKSERQRFRRLARDLLMRLGATRDNDPTWPEYVLDTRAGPLRLHIDDFEHKHAKGPGTVFARFDNPNRAMLLVQCNPYSGKWNFHFFSEKADAVDAAIRQVEGMLSLVLQTEQCT